MNFASLKATQASAATTQSRRSAIGGVALETSAHDLPGDLPERVLNP